MLKMRATALVLALAFSAAGALEAKTKPAVVKVQKRKPVKYKARKIKPYKIKPRKVT